MLKHETPITLLERIVQVFNKTFTTTLATSSYLGVLLKTRDSLAKMCEEEDTKQIKKSKKGLYDKKKGQFSVKLTKKNAATMLKTDLGSASR